MVTVGMTKLVCDPKVVLSLCVYLGRRQVGFRNYSTGHRESLFMVTM